MLKLLHTADWQIGKPYGQFPPEDAVLLTEARIDCVERMAKLASDQKVDAVLVAGDVFDAQTVADRTLYRLFSALQGFSGPWIMIPGNHDAALAESVWTRAKRIGAFPENVYLCTDAKPLIFDELSLAILPAPLTQRHTYQDLTAWFDAAEAPSSYYRIGLAHGSVQGILDQEIDSANPIALDRSTMASLDYLALGDWHGTRQINDRTWYSGTPEPDRFRNNESGQALLVTLEAPQSLPLVSTIETGRYRWLNRSLDINIDSDIEILMNWLNALDHYCVADLTLQGTVNMEGYQQIQHALRHAEGRSRVLLLNTNALRIIPSDEDLAQLAADGYVGDVIESLRLQQNTEHSDEESQAARDALILLADLLTENSASKGNRS